MSNGGLRAWHNNTSISNAPPWYRGTEEAAVQESGDRAQESDLVKFGSLTLPCVSCMNLGKLINLSMSQCYYL